jgi:parallel beta-helix repeat protein
MPREMWAGGANREVRDEDRHHPGGIVSHDRTIVNGSKRRLLRAGRAILVVLVTTAWLLPSLSAPALADAVDEVYVDKANPNCFDRGNGSASQPFCTIVAAAQAATQGKTVIVSSGTYSGQVNPNSGTVFTAAPGSSVTVTGGKSGFYLSGKNYVTVRGFNITGTTGDGLYVSKATGVSLIENHVSNSGRPVSGQTAKGIRLSNATNSLVSGNTVDHNTDFGIYLVEGSTGNTIVGNRVFASARQFQRAASGIRLYASSGNVVSSNVTHDNEDSGIEVYTASNNNVVVDNVSYNNGDHGIDSYSSVGNKLVSNSVYNNATAGINAEGGSTGTTIRNNISVDNGIGSSGSTRTDSNIRVDAQSTSGSSMDYDLVDLRTTGTLLIWASTKYTSLSSFKSATGQETHGIKADPGWAAPGAGDFHLSAGSPAIDSADSGAPGETTADADGNPRVDDPLSPNTGAGPRPYDDRGAYEFQPEVTDLPPSASLVVSPSSGMVPLEVTADASASTDTDSTPIASYEFDFGDGSAAVGPQAGATATHTYTAAGTYTVTVTVKDTAGLASTATTQVTATEASDAPPSASLVVSPSLGTAPLEVTADASASTDTDATPIASYEFDFDDGTIVGPQDAATATHTYTAAGTYTVTVTVKDTAGLASTATTQVTVKQNLVANSGFETDTSGWNTSGSGTGVTLARVSGGHSGGWAAKLANTSGSATTCLLNDSPNRVASTSVGSYTGSIWVRADTSGAVFNLRFREYSGATLLGSRSTQVTLTTSWQLVTVTYTPVSPNSSNLDFNAYLPASSAPPGTCFYADDAVITLG